MVVYDIWADTYQDNPPSADRRVAKLRLELNYRSLAELEEQGVVKWDKKSHVVRKGQRFNEKETEVMKNEY